MRSSLCSRRHSSSTSISARTQTSRRRLSSRTPQKHKPKRPRPCHQPSANLQARISLQVSLTFYSQLSTSILLSIMLASASSTQHCPRRHIARGPLAFDCRAHIERRIQRQWQVPHAFYRSVDLRRIEGHTLERAAGSASWMISSLSHPTWLDWLVHPTLFPRY
jgi:hypothetical protein